MITKPFYRIIRPSHIDFYTPSEYMLDNRYANDKTSLIHSYHLIESDFKKLFDYIELHEDNKSVFSHRIYELFLRTCTEFETNCTAILKANSYNKNSDLNMLDYFKINKASRLNEYSVRLNVWSPTALFIQPFKEWSSLEYKPLPWYKSYNNVKHDRSQCFKEANLGNLIYSIAGLLIILASQFNDYTFFPFTDNFMITGGDYRSAPNGLLSIKRPSSWIEDDYYRFDWSTIKNEDNPFQSFVF